MTREFNVLISSAGRRVVLLDIFRAALREVGLRGRVLACDMSRLSSAFHLSDGGYLVPRCTAPDFIPAVMEICRANDVRLVVPTIDTELPYYAEHRGAFDRIGATVGVSRPEVIAICGNKEKMNAWLLEQGFPTVRQVPVEEALSSPGEWPYPFLVKPRGGSASVGVSVVENREQLKAVTKKGNFIAQAIARGSEFTIDLLANRAGRCLCAVPRKRLEVRAGEVSKGMTVRNTALEDLSVRLCDALPGAFGVLNVQMFYEEDSGEIRVIEINPRFGGGFPLAWEAGAKYPRWMIEEIIGVPISASPSDWKDHLVMLRYDDAVFVNGDEGGR